VQAFASGSGSGAGVIISTAPSGRVVVDASTVSALTTSTAANAGPGGTISIVAEELALHNGANVLAASCITPTCDLAGATAGAGGGVAVSLSGSLAIDSGASLGTFTRGTGNAGNVSVTAVGPVTIDRGAHTSTLAGIGSRTGGQGNAGIVAVRAGALTLTNNGLVASVTLAGAAGNSGDVSVDVSGPLSIAGSSTGITGTTFSLGKGGDVTVNAGSITIGNSGSISSDAASSGAASSGNAGAVRITAGSLKIASSGEITSGTSGRGASGSVSVSVAGELAIDGAMTLANATTGIFSQANGGSTGDAGEVSVNAGSIFIINSGTISSGTFGRGNGGSVSVNVAGRLAIDGAMTPVSFTGISSQANRGSIGNAGPISITAGSVSLAHGGEISSTTFARGRGGTVAVAVDGLLAIDGSGTNPGATGIQTDSRAGSSGNAGDISVRAGALSLVHGGVISSALRPFMNLPPSTGNSGRITINVGGLLSISGSGSRIGTETNPGSIGDAGSITVDAAQITIASGGQIASSTAGAGKGGIVDVSADSDIVLRDPGPQIRAQSTGSGDAGSITIAATRLLLSDRAAISTEAATSTANGGNITLHVRDFLHLVSSEISTSVKGETGNGGNITIDPQLVILDHHSLIKADAIAGHGGNITITAGQFIPSSDSSVEATSELGISGTIVINGPRVDVNGALVVLSSQLRGRTEVLREACAARSDRPISSLVEAGRGGLPQDPEATLPALYLAGRDVNPNPQAGADATQASSAPLRTTVRLTMRCG
jgi:large exoprotein involved in heme utilization and adhesion